MLFESLDNSPSQIPNLFKLRLRTVSFHNTFVYAVLQIRMFITRCWLKHVVRQIHIASTIILGETSAWRKDTTLSKRRLPTSDYEAVKEILRTIRPIPPIPKEQEYVLIYKAKDGDSEAKLTLIRAYIPLILRIASNYGLDDAPLPDKVQDGIVGLLEAIERYNDTDGNIPLFAYARWRIIWAVQRGSKIFREESTEEIRPTEEELEVVVEYADFYSESLERVLSTFLSEVEREALLFKYANPSLSPEEAAKSLRMTVDSYKEAVKSGLSKVRKYWVPEPELLNS